MDLGPEGLHPPEVAVHGLQPEAAEPFPPLLVEPVVLLRELDSLVGKGIPNLDLELGLLPDQEGPSPPPLQEHRNMWWEYVALGEAFQPE